MVWLKGDFALPSCPTGFLERNPTPSDLPCLDAEGGLVAVLDQFSGALLGWTH
jgi:hypothetical protein